jgi:hypothetical protein
MSSAAASAPATSGAAAGSAAAKFEATRDAGLPDWKGPILRTATFLCTADGFPKLVAWFKAEGLKHGINHKGGTLAHRISRTALCSPVVLPLIESSPARCPCPVCCVCSAELSDGR